jgi:2-phosphosulfolactate phosphatase
LEGRRGDPEAVRRLIFAGRAAKRFGDLTRLHLHPGDLDIVPDIDRYLFAVRVTPENGRSVARIESMS